MIFLSTITICNAAVKSIAAVTLFNTRLKHSDLKFNNIMEHLGLPQRPKRPLNIFFKYRKEIRNSVIAEHPTLSPIQVNVLIAEMWRSLNKTKREEYHKEYRNEMKKHRAILAQYNNLFTEDDSQRIEERKVEITKEMENKEKTKSLRLKLREIQRPRLANGFFEYMYQYHVDRQPDERPIDYNRRKASEWRKFSQSEKDKFKPTAEEFESYRTQLLEWKGKMIKMGHYDLLGVGCFRRNMAKNINKTDKSKRKRKAINKSTPVCDDDEENSVQR